MMQRLWGKVWAVARLGLAFSQDLSASSSEALPSFTSIVYGRLLILSVSATIANDKCQAHAN